MYARGVQPRFPEAGEPTDNQMSVVITRLGWFVRNTAESEGLAQAGAYGAYLSHDDCGRYMVRVVESPTPSAPKPLITPIFPDFFRFFPVFPWTSGRVLWIPGVQTLKMGEKRGKTGRPFRRQC